MAAGTPPFAVVCAMESELHHAVAAAKTTCEVALGPWRLQYGTISGQDVVLLQSGIGMVNASAALSALCTHQLPRAVLNYGCAGAHHPDIQAGDVVVAEGVVAPGALTILPSGEERYTGIFRGISKEAQPVEVIETDPSLLAELHAASEGWQPPAWPWSPASCRRPEVHFGIVASADVWTQHPERLTALHTRHHSLGEDMEAAALAQVCALWNVPFCAVKDISNNELHEVTDLDLFGPTLEPLGTEVGSRAWQLIERAIPSLSR